MTLESAGLKTVGVPMPSVAAADSSALETASSTGRSTGGIGFYLAITAVAVIHLLMTGDRDILAVNQPYDDYWFVSTARRNIWSGPYGQMVFAQLQLYPIWLRLTNLVGVPGRLAIDLCWLLAGFYLASSVGRFVGRRWPALLLFMYLAWHPYSIALFDRALSENILACLVAVAMAAMIDSWNMTAGARVGRRYSQKLTCVVGFFSFACAYHVRKEGIVLVAPLLFIGVVSLAQRDLWWKRDRAQLALSILILPVAATILLGIGLASANRSVWGVFARYELAAPGYLRAIQALNAIEPDSRTPKWVTVTAATRRKAYTASPTFRELERWLEGPAVAVVVAQTEIYSGVKGEIGNGWFYWTLRDAAAMAGWHRSARHAEAKYNAMADEIETAFDRGLLVRRATPIPFVDPDWSKWLPSLPEALVAEARQMLAPDIVDLREPAEDATERQRTDYSLLTGRRRPFENAFIRGWMIAPTGTVIGLGDTTGSEASTTLGGDYRPDVAGAYPFHLNVSKSPDKAVLYTKSQNGARIAVALATLPPGQITVLSKAENIVLGVDELSAAQRPPWFDAWLPLVCRIWSVLGLSSCLVALLSIVWIGKHETSREVVLRMLMCALIIALASRTVLLAVLDSSSWSGTQARYQLPSVPVVGAFVVAGLCKVAERIATWRGSKERGCAP